MVTPRAELCPRAPRRLRREVVVAGLGLLFSLGCARFRQVSDSIPGRHTIVREQLVIASDFSLPQQHRLLEELVAQRYDLAVKLGLPTSDEPIHVFLFDNPDRFHAFTRQNFPEVAPRRAFFVESDTRLTVYAQWGDRVAEDLRHEVAHGYLHAVVPNLPLWIDEGLAEYFEVPRGGAGLNRPHVDALLRAATEGRWKPDLARLEHFRSIAHMEQLDYAESWAWIHLLLETTPERAAVLRTQLHALRQKGSAPALWTQLGPQLPQPETELLAHLRNLAATPAH
ncbi:MAG: DUF1570 domain-containing protein [Planctomycetaceae bacterium]|nr:DUF1570 domain-containing protein [Planctomycetaceae bacterium]